MKLRYEMPVEHLSYSVEIEAKRVSDWVDEIIVTIDCSKSAQDVWVRIRILGDGVATVYCRGHQSTRKVLTLDSFNDNSSTPLIIGGTIIIKEMEIEETSGEIFRMEYKY